MAIDIAAQYPGQSNAADANYPEGSTRNETTPGAGDGTPLDATWKKDIEGLHQATLAEFGTSASGSADTAIDSQYLDNLRKMTPRQWTLIDNTDSPFTASDGDNLMVDTTAGSVEVILPITPSAKATIRAADYAGTWKGNNVQFSRNGELIMALAEDFFSSRTNQNYIFHFIDSTQGWRIVR